MSDGRTFGLELTERVAEAASIFAENPCDIASARGFCMKGKRSALSPPALLRRADAPMSADNIGLLALASLGVVG